LGTEPLEVHRRIGGNARRGGDRLGSGSRRQPGAGAEPNAGDLRRVELALARVTGAVTDARDEVGGSRLNRRPLGRTEDTGISR